MSDKADFARALGHEFAHEGSAKMMKDAPEYQNLSDKNKKIALATYRKERAKLMDD